MAGTTTTTPWSIAKDRFLQDLEPSERRLYDNATLKNILEAPDSANREDASSSKTRTTLNKLNPLISALENYGSAFDTFAQIAPLYLAPIWSSIRVILLIAGSQRRFYDRIVDTLSRIGDATTNAYDRDKHPRLYQCPSDTYLEIVVLCTQFHQSIKAHQTSKVRRVFRPLAGSAQFEEAVERFRRHKKNVEKEASTCHLVGTAQQRDAHLISLATERRQKLLSKLSHVDCRRRHRRVKESRHEGTGLWLTAMKEYQDWYQSRTSSVLCCYGIRKLLFAPISLPQRLAHSASCGRSVIASSIVDAMLASKQPTAFYYCDHADKRSLEVTKIFGNLARQLLETIDPLSETLASTIAGLDHDGELLTDAKSVLEILVQSIQAHKQPVCLILDGLDDESEKAQRLFMEVSGSYFGYLQQPYNYW